MPDPGKRGLISGSLAGWAIGIDCFSVAAMDNSSRPRNIFFYPEVDTKDVAELK